MQPGNPVVGSTILRRPAIQSPNFLTGVSGWIIRADGTFEFNGGQFRGPVIIGTTPPTQGTLEFGLTTTSTPPIPAVLTGFSADYTWFEANLRYISTTDFFFEALVFNSVFNVTEWITGIYTVANGVQIQTLAESTANTLNYGTSNYDTVPLSTTWRNANVTFQADAPITLGVGGQQLAAAENGISNAAAADTTTSATFVNMAGTSSFSITKIYSGSHTRLRIDMAAGMFSTIATTAANIGVLINGTDHQITMLFINPASTHLMLVGSGYVTGLAAGTYTVQARWLRSQGTGTLTRDANDWLSVCAREVSM